MPRILVQTEGEVVIIVDPLQLQPLFDIQAIIDRTFSAHHHNSTPASKEAVASLPVSSITKDLLSIHPKCAICLDEFNEYEEVLSLPCKHVFHASDDCVKVWLKTHNTCPICRYKLPVDDPESEAKVRISRGTDGETSISTTTNLPEAPRTQPPSTSRLPLSIELPAREEVQPMTQSPAAPSASIPSGSTSPRQFSGLKRGFLNKEASNKRRKSDTSIPESAKPPQPAVNNNDRENRPQSLKRGFLL